LGGDVRSPDAPKNENLQTALAYADRGWHIFPCDPRDKSPLTANGFEDATTDSAMITAWFTDMPYAMIGIRTGAQSGIFVVDCDVDPEKGLDGIGALKELSIDLPETITVKTPRGGKHFYFAYPDGTEIRNSAGKIAPGIDVRGEGGYVIAAGSMRSDRIYYETLSDIYPDPAAAPQRLIDLVTNGKAEPELANSARAMAAQRTNGKGNGYGAAALDDECAKVAGTPSGARNSALNVAAFNLGQLVGGGVLSESEVRDRLTNAAVSLAKDDGDTSVRNTIYSGLAVGMAQPRGIPSPRQEAKRTKDKDDEPSPPPPLPWINMSSWDSEPIPEQQWAVHNRIPLRQCVLFSGEGAAGKSTVELHRSAAHVLGKDWLGSLPEQGPARHIEAEDGEDVIHRRLAAIARHCGCTFADLINPASHVAGRQGRRPRHRRSGR
jgi:Bifunctional DNA primase/polymerase, N-terminal/AAA domain